jgi:hypothetical protein
MNQLELEQKIHDLELALNSGDPNIPSHLKAIHTSLINEPELVYLLKEEDIAKIIKGMTVASGVIISTPKSKGKKNALSIDDLI